MYICFFFFSVPGTSIQDVRPVDYGIITCVLIYWIKILSIHASLFGIYLLDYITVLVLFLIMAYIDERDRVDGSWELNILVTDLQVERTLRVMGDLHIGGVMVKLVDALGKNLLIVNMYHGKRGREGCCTIVMLWI